MPLIPELLLLADQAAALPTTRQGARVMDMPAARRVAEALAPSPAADDPASLYALALLQGVFRHLLRRYRQAHPQVFAGLESYLQVALGREAIEQMAAAFAAAYGPVHGDALWENLLLLWVAHQNPAAAAFCVLCPIDVLGPHYAQAMQDVAAYFATQPPLPPENLPVPEALLAPAHRAPHSLSAQLAYVLEAWGDVLGDARPALLRGLDYAREAARRAPAAPPPPSDADFAAIPAEADAPEAYSPDKDWMPRLVLIAKHTYVWLAQLSQRFGRPIQRLDQIPDQALAELAEWGINGLWLIGVWERSPASQKIKRLTGNPDALASAYSVYDYRVAADLGGEEALQTLKARAAHFGIRLGADMVPNHMGLDSRWVIEHPDWFIQTDQPPFPNYRFTGPDLSSHPTVEIRIEDGYYTQTDAAVVFQMRDHRDGRTRYIYHGNDGTAIPWNDTAQLNHLLPEVREALIETILAVARRFPVIRFDAAMTLTRKHYQRLWFPAPGEGGAIPSRAEHGLSRAEFLRRMPREFWREVVDRVAAEAPDTLLLAEAFWLLEGYFVRTLGMHRVYNSAFMHMLRDERNAAYHKLVRETLLFDPRILQRYVNFMTTPDEKPAVVQFGKGDKYFGVATLMATLPGLPMFGHGQIEGLQEQYGHEFRAPRTAERRDEGFLAEHRRRIAPLLHQRALFAGVEAFRWFPLETEGGENPDVFAFTNGQGDARVLVVYHNRYAETAGRLHRSAPFVVPGAPSQAPRSETLAEALRLPNEAGLWVRFQDQVSGLWYLRSAKALHQEGLTVALRAYQAQVFAGWEVLSDPDGRWARLAEALGGAGVPDLEAAYRERFPPLEAAADRMADVWQRRMPLCQPLGPMPTAEDVEAVVEAFRGVLLAAEVAPERRAAAEGAFRSRVEQLQRLLAWLWQAAPTRAEARQRRDLRGWLCGEAAAAEEAPPAAPQPPEAPAAAPQPQTGPGAKVTQQTRSRWVLAALVFPHLPPDARATVAQRWAIAPAAAEWLTAWGAALLANAASPPDAAPPPAGTSDAEKLWLCLTLDPVA